jgi:hypothetical protein
MKNNDDETAFPITNTASDADMRGMSLRDYFAGQVLVGLYANGYRDDNTLLARIAYKQANEMMEARKTLG